MSGRTFLFAFTIFFLLSSLTVTAQDYDYELEQVFNESRVSFERPVDIVFYNENTDVLIIEKVGRIYHLSNLPNVGSKQLILDISSKVKDSDEEGLLGIALDPTFLQTGYFYIQYSEQHPTLNSTTRISRFTLDFTSMQASSEITLISEPQYFPSHKGGRLLFGNDSMLYFGFGDGGIDPMQAQNRSNLKGSLGRIDVSTIDTAGNYSVPADNPFVGLPEVREEIIAFGLRNPWRFSVDSLTGQIWIGDVGEQSYEEVDILESGANYGWPYKEGSSCRTHNQTLAEYCRAEEEDFTDPIFEYAHSPTHAESPVYGAAIVGGYVYRGENLDDSLEGSYIFSDFLGGVWSLSNSSGAYEVEEIIPGGSGINSYATDQNGEIIILTRAAGPNIFYLSDGSLSLTPNSNSAIFAMLSSLGLISSGWLFSQFRKEEGTVQRRISLLFVLVGGLVLRVSRSPQRPIFIELSGGKLFNPSGFLSPLELVFYDLLSFVGGSPLLFLAATSLISTLINLHLLGMFDKLTGNKKATLTLATILTIEPNLVALSLLGSFQVVLVWLSTMLYFALRDQVKQGGGELKIMLLSALLILGNPLLVFGVVVPSLLTVRSELGWQLDRVRTGGVMLLLILIPSVIISWTYEASFVDYISYLLFGPQLFHGAFPEVASRILSSTVLVVPFVVLIGYRKVRREVGTFLSATFLVILINSGYAAIASLLLIIVMAGVVSHAIFELNEDQSIIVTIMIFATFTVLATYIGVDSRGRNQFTIIDNLLKFLLIFLPVPLIYKPRYITRISLSKVLAAIIVIMMVSSMFVSFTGQPQISDKDGLTDISAQIITRFPDLVVFVPDVATQMQLSIHLPGADIRHLDETGVVSYFIENRGKEALLLLFLDNLNQMVTTIPPIDYNKKVPNVKEVSQSGNFGLFYIEV